MKCDNCLHHCRAVISENGLHFICGLSDRAANNCQPGECCLCGWFPPIERARKKNIRARLGLDGATKGRVFDKKD